MSVTFALDDWSEESPGITCPKCDADLFAQTDGSCLTVDIAHQGETISDAVDKMTQVLARARAGYYGSVRLIVGGGRIHDEIAAHLYFLQQQGRIISCQEAGGNPGAILVRIRK
ncbi:MAG: hypothetical protein RQ899_11550 [Pseudomonadales bacterium]|nr:hypothetical protein [Pseudomonadales bacterium]